MAAVLTDREDERALHGPSCAPDPSAPLVNGVRIDVISREGYLTRLAAFLECGRAHVAHFCAAHPTVEARRRPEYRELLNRGDLNLPDGLPVAWATRLQGHRAERLAGTDAMRLTVTWGVDRDLRHYLFGTTDETLGLLREHLVGEHPSARIVGAEAPPFRPMSDEELRSCAERMRAANAQVVWVGLGAPKQDVVANRLRELDAAPAIMCVGAAFDFVAGVKRRAPRWMQRIGLEWAFRLAAEPRRLWRRYLVGNARFLAGVLADFVRRRGSAG